MDLQETIQFTRITQALGNLYPKLMNEAAIEAVNFFKERLVLGRDINNVPFKKRSDNIWIRRGRDKKGGRAILVDTGIMKKDIKKIYVGADYAIVGTSRISAPRAKAHNEGFSGTVTQNVKAHTRRRFSQVSSSNVKTRRSTTKKVATGEIEVKPFTRRIKQNIPQRQFMGNSPMLDRRIQAMVTRKTIETIQKAKGNGNNI